jgi:hypothetical protein
MIRIKGFLDFTRINESENDYKNPIEREYPELWDEMKSMGFVDVSTPIMKKNGTIWLKNPIKGFNENGYTLRTKSGWLAAGINRSKLFNRNEKLLIFQSIEKGLSVEEMAQYVIKIYERRKSINDRVFSRLSKYPEEEVRIMRKISSASFKKSKKTGEYAIYGSAKIDKNSLLELKRLGIKISKIKRDLTIKESFDNKESIRTIDLNQFSDVLDISKEIVGRNIRLEVYELPSKDLYFSNKNIVDLKYSKHNKKIYFDEINFLNITTDFLVGDLEFKDIRYLKMRTKESKISDVNPPRIISHQIDYIKVYIGTITKNIEDHKRFVDSLDPLGYYPPNIVVEERYLPLIDISEIPDFVFKRGIVIPNFDENYWKEIIN